MITVGELAAILNAANDATITSGGQARHILARYDVTITPKRMDEPRGRGVMVVAEVDPGRPPIQHISVRPYGAASRWWSEQYGWTAWSSMTNPRLATDEEMRA